MAAKLTTQDFIDRARSAHGDRYGYAKAEYKSAHAKVTITCSEHGDFHQRACDHLKGKGCIECGRNLVGLSKRITTDKFIERAKAVHGERYEYSKARYVNSKTKVVITCKIHGEFNQAPNNHLTGRGCPECAEKSRSASRKKRWNTEYFKRRAKDVHGSKYDYRLVRYTKNNLKVEIVCPEHGSFKQAPYSHLQGNGCPKCSGVGKVAEDEWIKRALMVHGGRYTYPRGGYVGARREATITCPEHGDFKQVAYSHLAGRGCPHCSGRAPVSPAEWVARAHKIHGNKYSYEKTRYLRSSGSVIITCKDHGDFTQKASHHSSGVGCPRCTWDRSQPTSVYLLKMGRLVKVGVSIDPLVRLARLNKDNPSPAKLLMTWALPDFPAAQKIEFAAHAALAYRHAGLAGFDGATEWFHVSPSYAANIIDRLIDGDPCQLSFKFLAA